MMKKAKRFFAVMLASALTLSLFSGCSNNQPGGSSTPSTSAPSTSSPGSSPSDDNPLGLSEEITISYSHVQSTTSPTHRAVEWLNEWLQEQSGGYVSIEIFPAGQLYNDSTEIDAIVGGNIDMVSTYMSKLTSIDTDAQYCLAPYLFDDVHQMEAFYVSEYAQPLYEKINDLGIKVVDVMFGGEQYFMSNGDSIASIDGFQGKKVREGGGAMIEALFGALGASVTTVSFNELYTAMQTKLVDIAVTSVDSAVSIQLQEVVSSVSSYDHQFAPYLIMFNQDTWDSYPVAVQDLLTEGFALAREKQLEYTDELCSEALETIQATCEYHDASQEEIDSLKAIWTPIVEQYVSSEWIDSINAFKETYTPA